MTAKKSIDAAVTRLFPNAQHAFSVCHIQKNVKVHFHTTLDGLLFKAAKAECAETFEIVMAEMRRLDSTAGEYVSRIGNERWARAFFPGRRFGHVTSNISESMNWLLEKARYLEPVGFFSTFIRKTNALFEKRRLHTPRLPSKKSRKAPHKGNRQRQTTSPCETQKASLRLKEKMPASRSAWSTLTTGHVRVGSSRNTESLAVICATPSFPEGSSKVFRCS